ncbi:pentapeptide repeat-containing protein [Nostoc sp.]|uniref:pentapeptide repeat-containing protein n=1 Tax=Nostoc sp. TaxID=1180 RepID=UPI002FFBAF0C
MHSKVKSQKLWRELGGRVDLGRQSTIPEIADRVYQLWQTQNVLLIFYDVNCLPEAFIHELIRDFWLPLATKAREATLQTSDLSEADLQRANLSRAKLINTRLNGANLAITQLTGAFIYNFERTSKTKLAGVEYNYIYTQLPTNDNPDPGRKPQVNGRIFKPGELAEVLMTLYSTQSTGHKGDRSIN